MKHKQALKPFIAMVCISLALLAIIQWVCAPFIQQNQIAASKKLIRSIIPPAYAHVFTTAHLSRLQADNIIQIPLDCTAGIITLVRTQTTGYSSKLTTITSTLSKGQTEIAPRIYGVRVVPPQQETPGLGDVIMPNKSDWITQFKNLKISAPLPLNDQQAHEFKQRIDHISGATISTGAVIKAVARALQTTLSSSPIPGSPITGSPITGQPNQSGNCGEHKQ